KTASELVAVMTTWQQAVAKKDLTGFQATIDLTRAAFRRCQSETFDIASRQGFSPTTVKIAKVEPYLDLYARAYVGDDANGYSRGGRPERGVHRRRIPSHEHAERSVHPPVQQRADVQARPLGGHRHDGEHHPPRRPPLAPGPVHPGHLRPDAVLARRGLAGFR